MALCLVIPSTFLIRLLSASFSFSMAEDGMQWVFHLEFLLFSLFLILFSMSLEVDFSEKKRKKLRWMSCFSFS
jgi:hypothetical protein